MALSLSQTVPVAGAIVVTTPQQVSLADSRRAVAMYKKLNIPPLGIIENMSYFVCTDCHHEADIFGHGGGEKMAAELGVPFIGRIPIYQPIREGSDTGVPLMISEPDSPAGRAFMAAAERTAAQVSIASFNRPNHSAHGGQMTHGRMSSRRQTWGLTVWIGLIVSFVASACAPAPQTGNTPAAARR